ncbi:MAG: metal ABC transporter permease [Verrucomicrobiota bacterium]|nr:metal ABC transporter permease [Verrucomicrobiota bacterium]
MSFSLLDFFTHPILRGPTWGTLFLCLSSSLMGVILLLQRRPLLSEALSHTMWPGILLALFFPIPIALGGILFALLGYFSISFLEKKKVPSDTALAFSLASFFGLGVTLASALQIQKPKAYQEVQHLLLGQAAILDDKALVVPALLTLAIVLLLLFRFRSIQLLLFDPAFARCSGLARKPLELALLALLLLSLLSGIRSVGVLLLSGIAIAPAIAARQFTNRLQTLFLLAALFGALSGLFGIWLSVWGTTVLSCSGSLPTGPTVIAVGGTIALLSLLFAPKRGWLFRFFRIAFFRLKCIEENVLKTLWKQGTLSFSTLKKTHCIPFLRYILWRLQSAGWVEKEAKGLVYRLSPDGVQKAASIVRLHRLWELYLTSSLGLGKEKVHGSAEEMEHILTPELEKELTHHLSHPEVDPHDQQIPSPRRL